MCEWRWIFGDVIKHLEMVDMYAENFGVWECKGVEGIWMVLKISEVHKCQNMWKCGSMCAEQVHTPNPDRINDHYIYSVLTIWRKNKISTFMELNSQPQHEEQCLNHLSHKGFVIHKEKGKYIPTSVPVILNMAGMAQTQWHLTLFVLFCMMSLHYETMCYLCSRPHNYLQFESSTQYPFPISLFLKRFAKHSKHLLQTWNTA